MINFDKMQIPVSNMTKNRMRYRGPVQSVKMDNFKSSFIRDIHEIDTEMKCFNSNLRVFLSDISIGNTTQTVIFSNDKVVFKCNENITLDSIMPNYILNNITR